MTYRNLIDLDDVAAGDGGIKIVGESTRDFAGKAVAGGFDINGDGFADLIVGAYGNDTGGDRAGAAYVVFGVDGGFGPVDQSGRCRRRYRRLQDRGPERSAISPASPCRVPATSTATASTT